MERVGMAYEKEGNNEKELAEAGNVQRMAKYWDRCHEKVGSYKTERISN